MSKDSILNERSGLFFIEVGTYVALAGYVLYKLSDWGQDLSDAADWVGDKVGAGVDWVEDEYHQAGEVASDVVDWVADEAHDVGTWFGDIENTIENTYNEEVTALENWWDNFTGNNHPNPPGGQGLYGGEGPVGSQAGSQGYHPQTVETDHGGMANAGDDPNLTVTAPVQTGIDSTTAQLQAAGLIPPTSAGPPVTSTPSVPARTNTQTTPSVPQELPPRSGSSTRGRGW